MGSRSSGKGTGRSGNCTPDGADPVIGSGPAAWERGARRATCGRIRCRPRAPPVGLQSRSVWVGGALFVGWFRFAIGDGGRILAVGAAALVGVGRGAQVGSGGGRGILNIRFAGAVQIGLIVRILQVSVWPQTCGYRVILTGLKGDGGSHG